jgi:DNA (cytosine-5)-methyltransferase 1
MYYNVMRRRIINYREIMDKTNQHDKKLTYIDLFAGAGGLSEGFIRNKYVPVAHVEMDGDACNTLKTRLAYHHLKKTKKLDSYLDYLQGNIDRLELYRRVPDEIIKSVLSYEISKNNVKDVFRDISLSMKQIDSKEVDIIVGGPPCQAYSKVGRAAKITREDKRNYLYKEYAKFLIEYRPKLFVFENVPGLYTANKGEHYKNLRKYFRRIGYYVEDRLLDAADFGVLQRRKRVIFIGWRKDLTFAYPDFGKVENRWTVHSLFQDLPILKAGEERLRSKYRTLSNEYLDRFEIRNGIDFVTQNLSRPHNVNDLRIYRRAIELWETQGKRLMNNEIPVSERTQKNVTAFLDRFKVVVPDNLSHTILAHISKDGHYYIHPDKNQLRSITVREAARIQSFPDDYFFEGSRTSVFGQIGNAVPPLMAEVIAKKIKEIIP